ncbi:MAG TPA: hypothetical protein VHY58_17430 [Streptosporangiaceae bacterium]|jgi:hypothetical protein|nr:hypothetical protein [Streptosporangiaceae bacterium]
MRQLLIPPVRYFASIAYDAATGNMVLFGLFNVPTTWVWDGTTWTQQHPATSPPARFGASMTYDVATGNAVLFGGNGASVMGDFADTWTLR